MGFILEPTPDMAPWRTEVRLESAYFYGGQVRVRRAEGRDSHIGFAIPTAQARSLSAALGQAVSSHAFPDRWRTPWQETAGVPEPGNYDRWAEIDGWLYVDGACYGYGATDRCNGPIHEHGWVDAAVAMADGASAAMLEISYAVMVDARNLLHAALSGLETDGSVDAATEGGTP
ncbi:hypothetical protein [Nocardia gipuzkoensis]|uniref:hypothetical protein n=1 Tax=Nocardia gipuzkoensis TaxID=2749991 RepID=UPI00237EA4B8|nr:hypothetical protein [Nocardia gipuzkoensis]MDE1673818.1 hypothetical protein [Nocardia gipuzkoensis]